MKYIILSVLLLGSLMLNQAQKIDVYNRPVQHERSRDFDALHYRIALDVDLENKMLNGVNTITLTPLSDGLETIVLDAVSLVVTEVLDGNKETLTFSQSEDKVSIRLPDVYSHKDTVTLSVRYYLTEQVLGLRFIDATADNPLQVSSDCFPNKARQWIPCYDYPHDKITQDMIVTVDDKYKVLSNGSLVGIEENKAEGKHSYHWRQILPHSTYLINLSIADYAVIRDSLGSLPVNYWVYHWNVEDARSSLEKTPDMIKFFNELYQYEYPWDKYDQVISAYMGGGAEATSATLLGEAAVTDERAALDYSFEGVIAHEIAHQWWGDLVTLRSWEHTWMNESFGTYSDYLYKVHAWESDEAAYDLIRKKNGYLREAHNRYMRPVVFNRYEHPGQNFDSHTYPKGACILHMLRYIIGDDSFFRTLSTFLHRHEFQPVTTQDFMKCVKDVTGKNMDWFFEQFLFHPGHAFFEVTKTWDETTNTLTLKIVQTQDKWDRVPSAYRIPVNIGLRSAQGKRTEKVWLDEKTEVFQFKLDAEPLLVRFDEGNYLLKEWTFHKPEEELIYQAMNDDMTGRLWAVEQLHQFRESDKTMELWSEIAVNDSFWAVREAAVRQLGSLNNSRFRSIFYQALEDPKSNVRAAALVSLGKSGEKDIVKTCHGKFENDESYLVMAEALRQIGNYGDRSRLEFLEEARKMKSPRNVVSRAAGEAIEMIQSGETEKPGKIEPLAWWDLNVVDARTVSDRVSGMNDTIHGNFSFVSGVDGQALKFDGFTTSVIRSSEKAPDPGNSFTVEAWVAAATYPWNWCPIIARGKFEKNGIYFGVGPQGQAGIFASVNGIWQGCESKEKIGLREWNHLAATYDKENGFRIYINGELSGQHDVQGNINYAPESDLIIGMNPEKMMPSHPVRTYGTIPAWYSFDGIYDEIKIYNGALSERSLEEKSRTADLPSPELKKRVMPSGPEGPGKFGAYYTHLKYYDEWDDLFRVEDHPDIVVQFDDSPVRVVFWRGTRYSPAWVMENGQWMADQSAEYFDTINGCYEHMIDPHCLYSHVRIIENNPARIVVHWRYVPVSVRKQRSQVDEKTDWSDCIDEYYTFFPDGIGIRKVIQHTSGVPLGPSEAIILCQPGTTPEDNVHLDAMTLVNMEGEHYTYSWAGGAPLFKKGENPENPVIQIVNLKSENKPFTILEKENNMEVFGHEQRPDVSHFPWWNHWPVAQNLCDGRYSQAPDRPSHFSLAWGGPPFHDEESNIIKARESGSEGELKMVQPEIGKTVKTFWSSWMYGASTQTPGELAILARSWLQPAPIKIVSGNFTSEGYDFTQRAYILNSNDKNPGHLELELGANADSPLVNICFLIRGWESEKATVQLNGSELKENTDYRLGRIRRLEREDLILWLDHESASTARIHIQ
jgi:aminopeptidase N